PLPAPLRARGRRDPGGAAMSAGGAPPRVRGAAAGVWRGGHVLLTRRPPGGPLGLMWEFPGGKIEAGESVEQALVRELREELGITVEPRETLAVERHDYPHGLAVEVHFVRCGATGAALVPGPGVHEVRWAAPGDVDPGEVLAADRAFLARLSAAAAKEA
ncbi:MAG TPA: (deoxy)nucleoside triphosphate pyrophosphohydrolase, partial [Candidatus Eisenbacteria bacterium]